MIAHPPLIFGAAFLLGSLVHSVYPRPILPLGMAAFTGVGVLALGAALAVWSRRSMESAGTSVNPSRPATTLVMTGPFQFSRNPMYLARTLLYVGLGLLANALSVLLALIPLLLVLHYGVVKREERYLEAKFGESYKQYRASVRRWL